ncbi:hypothetical protein AMECASPLE_029635 [Ameca splendens]|uniref:Uncharacterized protein n=1 Tax=Ameca splendens TaxID=208324 RepID=A0ABV0Z588_9TELE
MWALKYPSRIMEHDYAAHPIGMPRPVPNPKAQGCDSLIHWGKPQHETAELGGNKQTHPSPPPTPQQKRVQPLLRRWDPEPTLCLEVSPTISSRYLSTSRTNSGSFPPSELNFHVPRASLSI